MMKIMKTKVIIFCVLLSLYSSCASQNIFGTYKKEMKYIHYTLELRSDSTFFIKKQNLSMRLIVPNCEGKFYVKNNTIFFICDEEPPLSLKALTPDYWDDREFKAVILNNKKLKYGNLILKRTKGKE